MIGKTISHYRIISLLGKGGMGEVYLAEDTTLNRKVALKFLHEAFTGDPERMARFEREAKLIASLNHPNIAGIYGLEQVEGTRFLALELIEGQTLADRLKQGPIPVEESLKLALQIAEALEAAHEKGIIHRDLKPANIKITPEGKVKVLDFGLAKAFAGETTASELSNSPTLSDAATRQGVILGTAAYMSPEQATGKSVDKRTDIWAFGVVLFEMLTGKKLFGGDTVTETIADVIKGQPEWDALPPNLHPRVRFLLERCLEKIPKNRCGGISEAKVDIQKVLSDPSGVYSQSAQKEEHQKKLRLGIPWIAATAVLCLMVAGITVWKLKPKEPRHVTAFCYELPESQQFGDLIERAFAVSPDGRKVVYSTSGGLYLRSMNELNSRLIAGTEGAQKPFFSPDGKWVGYESDGQLKKIAVTGGDPVVLTNAGTMGLGCIDWGSDDTILYSDYSAGIMRVSANGGHPEKVFKPENNVAISPQLLPDRRSVLFTTASIQPSATDMVVSVLSLESGESKELIQGNTARYLPTGHLVYAFENDLFAIPFDLDKLEVTGGPISMVEGVFRAGGAPQYAVSDAGTLAYLPGAVNASSVSKARRAMVWVDGNGKEEMLPASLNAYAYPKVSPDGTRVAVTIANQSSADIWIWDLIRKTMTRLTFDESTDLYPLWSPDGKKIAFFSIGEEESGIYWKSTDGTGEAELLISDPDHMLIPSSWTRDGNTLCFMEFSSAMPISLITGAIVDALFTPEISTARPPDIKLDIGVLSMEGKRERKLLLQDKYLEGQPDISPDGRWLVYISDEAGRREVYVRPFPEVNGGKWQISTGGGCSARWSPDGGQLFFRSGDAMMAVSVDTDTTFKAGAEKTLFEGAYSPWLLAGMWDLSPDGKRFLMVKESGTRGTEFVTQETEAVVPRRINIVLNWFEELKKRAPVNK